MKHSHPRSFLRAALPTAVLGLLAAHGSAGSEGKLVIEAGRVVTQAGADIEDGRIVIDGGRIVVSLLPHRFAWRFARIEPYGFVILLVLLLTGVLGYVLLPPIAALMQLIAALFGLSASDLARLTSVI